jgi:hypothetical protein
MFILTPRRTATLCLTALLYASGCAASGQKAGPTPGAINVDAGQQGNRISRDSIGVNLANWWDITKPGVAKQLRDGGFGLVRWPGGPIADGFHWRTNTLCWKLKSNPNATFDNFMKAVAQPANLDVAITVNYGSGPKCDGGGDPAEAAGWVDYANNKKHYNIKYWTVGNEPYGTWSGDMHPRPHDAETYAAEVANTYYPQMKAKDKNILVGVVADPNPQSGLGWNATVFSQAKFDFVEMHYFAQAPGQENDTYLLGAAPFAASAAVATVRKQMTDNKVPTTVPIFVGSLGSVYGNPGKQTSTIVQALFAGTTIAELMKTEGGPVAWWMGHGNCTDPASHANFSPTLYGWQNFGGYALFADGLPNPQCRFAGLVQMGTPLPTARAIEVVSNFAHDGEHLLATSVPTSLPAVRAYAATQGGGYALLLINLDGSKPAPVTIALNNLKQTTLTATAISYTRAIYDASVRGHYLPPVTTKIGTVKPTFAFTLPQWSITAITLK